MANAFDPKQEAQLKQVLIGVQIDNSIKRDAWNAFYESDTPEAFLQGTQKLPPGVRNQLYNLKFGEPPKAGQPMPSIPGSQPSFRPGDITRKDVAGAAVEALPMVGGAVGGAVGGPAAAGMGGMAGEMAREAIVSKVGPENLSGNVVHTDAPPGAGERTSSILKSGVEQGLYEGVGRAAAGAVRSVSGPLHGASIRPENLGVKKAAEESGLRLTGPEVAGSGFAAKAFHTAQRLGEYSFFAQKYIESAREAGVDKALGYIDDFLGKLHPPTSPLEVGEAARTAFKESHQLFRETAANYFGLVDQEANGVMVNMKGVKSEAQRILANEQELQEYFQQTGMGSAAKKILEDGAKSQDYVPFKIAQQWRTRMRGVTPQADQLMASEAEGVAKNMVKHVTNAMETSAGALNPKALKAWESARRFYEEGAELFDTHTIQGLMRQDKGPEMIAEAIKPGDVTVAKRIRSAILDYPSQYGTPADKQVAELTWRQFQEQFVRTNFLENPEQTGGKFGVDQLMQNPQGMKERLDRMGPAVLKEVFGKDPAGQETLANLRNISEAMARMEKLPTEGRRFVYDVLSLVTGITGAATGHGGVGLGGATVFEAMPLLITGGMYNKRAAAALVDGLGGILKTFDNPILKGTGKAVINLSDKTLTSPASYKYGGKVMADIGRAWSIVQADREKAKKQAEKAAQDVEDQDPLLAPFQ